MRKVILPALMLALTISLFGQAEPDGLLLEDALRPQTPIMGWSSWNNFRIDINENLIREMADAMVASGMDEVGYEYINIDDGYFGSRNDRGELQYHPEKFPSGMRTLSDYIHSKGLRAGIYTDAGHHTCGAHFDDDAMGYLAGLYQHEEEDLHLMLIDWHYDFIKVDWCGGSDLGLDEEETYSMIGDIIRELRPDVVYNICRWQFPGEWAKDVADSWRISGDIRPTFHSVTRIIDLNADLWMHAGPGHVNDMDMLQVGRGMKYEEDKAHFTMWCMMNSPLLAGNDLRTMSEETLEILTNKEIIALNQDPLVYQARRMIDKGKRETWAKPLGSVDSGTIAVTLLNRCGIKRKINFELEAVGIDPSEGYTMKDLWSGKVYSSSNAESVRMKVPKHGVVALKIYGASSGDGVYSR